MSHPALAALAPSLSRLANQAEAVAAASTGLLPGFDPLPEGQRAAWRRVLTGFAKSEGFEEWVMEPTAKGLVAAGLGDEAVLRFFKTQGEDELRHRDMFLAYLRTQLGYADPRPSFGSRLLYDGFFRALLRRSGRKPLRLLLPLLVFEKTGTLYLKRLLDCAGADKPILHAMVQEIFRDESRHVAGVGAACRALVTIMPPGPAERAFLRAVCRLVVMDMDRKAWWKPGLRDHIAALGLDADAMNADNEAIFAEMCAIIDGRAPTDPLQRPLDADQHPAL